MSKVKELKRGPELLSIEQVHTSKGPVFIGFVDRKPVAVCTAQSDVARHLILSRKSRLEPVGSEDERE